MLKCFGILWFAMFPDRDSNRYKLCILGDAIACFSEPPDQTTYDLGIVFRRTIEICAQIGAKAKKLAFRRGRILFGGDMLGVLADGPPPKSREYALQFQFDR